MSDAMAGLDAETAELLTAARRLAKYPLARLISLVESDDKLIERPTKTGTKGYRTIAVDAATLAAVEALRVRQAGAADEHGLPAPEYVFTPARP